MTAHTCDDTAYQAAAMPGECTCAGSAPMTLEQLKDLFSTYGSNPRERSAEVRVVIDGPELPVTEAEMQWGEWDEQAHTWINEDRLFVILTVKAVQA